MSIPGLQMGGAETFFTRLAVRLKSRGHVVVVSLFGLSGDADLLGALEKAHIPVHAQPLWRPGVYRIAYKLSLELQRFMPEFSLAEFVHCVHLRHLHARHNFEAVNAHLIPAQRIACLAFPRRPPKIVGSDHGDWRWQSREACGRVLEPVAARMDTLVMPCQDNLVRVESYKWATRIEKTIIHYGYEPPRRDFAGSETGANNVFTFGMVARGSEPGKGWNEAVEAFLLVRERCRRAVRLLLVGEGKALDAIKPLAGAGNDDSIVFAGYQSAPEEWISKFDVALLPTCYGPESLPCVIIECLAQGKPVIATSIAGIPEMLCPGEGVAGSLIPIDQNTGRASIPALADAMARLCTDKAALTQARSCAQIAATAFDMDLCSERYEAIFTTSAK